MGVIESEIHFHAVSGAHGVVGNIILNRSSALNALSLEMIHKLRDQLHIWASDSDVKCVCIQANGERSFCAGGDIRAVYYLLQQQNYSKAKEYFYEEYRLNYLIKHYPKPYIALMHGIVMGGGVGISNHGSLRLADNDIRWAMPETGIGFFPDVGATYTLSRCEHDIGVFLGLTGENLNIDDCIYAKLVDAYLPRSEFNDFIQGLADSRTIDIKNIILGLKRTYAKNNDAKSRLELESTVISEIFQHDDVSSIMHSLRGNNDPWSKRFYSVLQKKSPMSLHVTLKGIRQAAEYNFAQCLNAEYAMSKQFLRDYDFKEGIRAQVIDKDKMPRWRPDKIDDITNELLGLYFPNLINELKLPSF